ncbi:MAG: hypothetical protein LBT92_01565 [Rickettsiales bacterium]|jgi:carboxyl-terminal processing protease|nr:hypothetical protein [Rickettsiales bacterium]
MKGKFFAALLALSGAAGAAAVETRLTGDISGGGVSILNLSKSDLDKYGYKDKEYWEINKKGGDAFSIKDAQEFYLKLYTTISEKFVKKISYMDMTTKALESLSAFAGRIELTMTDQRLMIHDRNMHLLGNFRSPAADDAEAWVNMLINIIMSLRNSSEKIASAHQEQIFYQTSAYLLKYLDDNAQYFDAVSAKKYDGDYHTTTLGFTYRTLPFGIQVLDILKNSPLDMSKMEEGDVITHINTVPVTEMTPEQVAGAVNGDTLEIIGLNYVSYSLSKPEQTFVRRNRFEISPVTTTAEEGKPPILTIHNFSKGTAETLKTAIEALGEKAQSGIVIDVRANVDGELMEALESVNLFVHSGDILRVSGRPETQDKLYSAKEGDVLAGAPIVIIADHTARGTSEIFAFAMANSKRAVVLGSLTYGNGYVEEVFDLTGGRKAQFAVGSVQSPDGKPLDKIGVVPLVCLASFRKLSDADDFVNTVNQGKFKDTRPSLDNPTQDDITAARKACPAGYPTLKIQKLATDIALRIVSERDAYPRLKAM